MFQGPSLAPCSGVLGLFRACSVCTGAGLVPYYKAPDLSYPSRYWTRSAFLGARLDPYFKR